MTRPASSESIRAPFDGAAIRLGPATAIAEQAGAHRFIRLRRDGEDDSVYRVTKVIGGRVREDFAGVRVDRAHADSTTLDAREQILPLSYVLDRAEWRYKGYSVMVPERPDIVVGPEWSQSCILCHNTAPAIVSLYDELAQKRLVYQGAPSELLPGNRRVEWSVDAAKLRPVVEHELELLGGEPKDTFEETLAFLARTTYREFGEEHLVELGIGCEACHHGGRAHAEDPSVRMTFEPRHPGMTRRLPNGLTGDPALEETRVCARCHTVLFSQYEETWEGGLRSRDPGGSTINSGEARDFLLGGCASKMTCSACHDPHGAHDESALDALATSARNGVCTESCHASLGNEDALKRHAHHDPKGKGGACISCHMPKKNMGLDYDLTRYHRIGSPTDAARVEKDRPLECTLCHTSWSVERTLGEMERLWGRRYDSSALSKLYPDPKAPVLYTTLALGRPHERAVAAATLSHEGDPSHAPLIEPLLTSEYPLLRLFAREALGRLRKKP